jgi:CPA1 family monovalent cation:H+ antiporter
MGVAGAVVVPVAAAGGHRLEVVVLGLLAAVAVLFLLAYLTGVPYPIWLTLGGGALGFVPGVPDVRLSPDLVLIVVLPPLLASAAYFSSLRDLRFNARPIALLSVGLVVATTFGVAAVAHRLIPGLSWEAALVLGAVLGPTDPVAATAIAGRVGAPRRIVTVLEGESLVNDASALIAFRFASAAVVTGTFSLLEAVGEFVEDVAGGLAVGLLAGVVLVWLFRRIDDPATEAAMQLVSPYLSYLGAQALGFSGVIAAVTGGLYLGWHSAEIMSAQSRIQLTSLWQILVFLLNSLLFVLVGLQLPTVVAGLRGEDAAQLAGYALLVALTVMAVRFLWVFPFTYGPRRLRRVRERDPDPPWRHVVVVAFTGMRGAVSLAAALSIPTTIEGGAPFPARDLIVFLVYTTILWTVVVEGLSLPWLLRALGVHGEGEDRVEEDRARLVAAQAALERVEQLAGEEWVRPDTAERVRGLYAFRARRFRSRLGDGSAEEPEPDIDGRSRDYQRLVLALLEAERDALQRLRRSGEVSDDVMRRVERDLDLEEARLDLGRSR